LCYSRGIKDEASSHIINRGRYIQEISGLLREVWPEPLAPGRDQHGKSPKDEVKRMDQPVREIEELMFELDFEAYEEDTDMLREPSAEAIRIIAAQEAAQNCIKGRR
jgi:hypothetical protein